MKKLFAIYLCILAYLTGVAQYQYTPWTPDQGPLNFMTLDVQNHQYIRLTYNEAYGQCNNYENTLVTTNQNNNNSSNTHHKLITTNGSDNCRCYYLDGVAPPTTPIRENFFPTSDIITKPNGDQVDTVIRLGCHDRNSDVCTSNSQIEYWFYPQVNESTLLVCFSFAEEDASHEADYNPHFYIEVLDGDNNSLIQSGYYPTEATAYTDNEQNCSRWPYSRFLAIPSGTDASSGGPFPPCTSLPGDHETGVNQYNFKTYYWAHQDATPTTFPFRICPSNAPGNSSDLNIKWFEYKPIAFNLKQLAKQNVDINGNFIPNKSVKLRIRSRTCCAFYHWAYALFYARMIPGTIQVNACGAEPISLSVPQGFLEDTYEWHFGFDSADAVVRPEFEINETPGVTPLGPYEILIDRDVLQNTPNPVTGQPGKLWPYYCCKMRSYTGVPFFYAAEIKSYFLEPDFKFKQLFDNCDLRAKLIDASRIFTVTPPGPGQTENDTTYESKTIHIQWFVKNYQTSQPNNDRYDSIPYRYGDTSFTYVFNYPYIDTLTGEAFVKIIIKDSLQKCEKEIEKSIQLDLNALQKPSTHDTLVTCREKLPYVFDRANLLNDAPVWNPQQDTTTFDTVWYKKKACNGCDSGVIVTLIVRDPKVEITTDPDFCEMFSTNLTAKCIRPGTNNEEETVLQYKWGDGETSPSITVDKPGRYSVEIINKDSCIATGNITIPACVPFMNLPNTFSPGTQDGVNDYFYIPQSSLIEELEFTVFNRNGIVVYHTTNKNFEWNGTENGRLYVGATYNYILRIKPYGSGWLDPIKRSITIF